MPDLMWPVTLVPSRSELKFIDGTARSESPFDGYTRTMIRPGSKIKMSLQFRELRDSDRKLGMSILTGLRGASGRLWMHDHTHRLAGAFATSELVPSPTMASIAGYTAGSSFAATQIGRILRMARTQNTGSTDSVVRITDAATVTAYAPYVGRVMVHSPRGDNEGLALRLGSTAFGSEYASLTAQTPGMLKLVAVPLSTSLHFGLVQGSGSGGQISDTLDIPFMSLSRCGLIDNGRNGLRHSEEMAENPTFWPNTASSWDNDASVAPNGATVADELVEDTANSTHYTQGIVTCPADIEDYCFAIALKAGVTRTFAKIGLLSTPTNTQMSCYLNLTTGAVTNVSTGADWANVRTVSVSLGNGWWYLAIIGLKNSSDISLRARIQIASAAGTETYTGSGSGSINIWRPTVARSSVPVRLTNNGATANLSGDGQDLGGGFWTTGWPASIAGLFEAGDVVEINGRKHWLRHRVDSDAVGFAQMYLSPIPRIAPADNEPVIAVQPHGKYFLMAADPGWMTQPPGFRTDLDLELMEAA